MVWLNKSRGRKSHSRAPKPRRQTRLSLELLEPRNLLAVVVNEFHYNPDDATEKVEFIELHNTGASTVNLAGWRIDEAVDYTFPAGASIAAGGYLVIAQDSADFDDKFDFLPFGQWEAGDKLSNDGETIELRDAANNLIDTVTYQLGFPWPTTGDFGSSLELINPAFDNDLAGNWRSSGITSSSDTSVDDPTPGAKNSVFAANAAPQMRQLTQSVQQPTSGEAVTISIKVTDADGVQAVTLDYQLVNPGNYIRRNDSAYNSTWTTLVMHDDGLNGDSVYSVVMAGSLQTNRRLVRYRINATDNLGATVRGPYGDDLQPNFAYYVYDGIPSWTGANEPGVTSTVTFGTNITQNGPAAYHLIARNNDVNNSQYNSSYENTEFYGTMVYDGVVYDHVTFKVRGEYSTFVSGKNKWQINFNRGHEFAARDNYGKLYAEKWRRMNLNANASPWAPHNRGMAGLDEAVSFRIYQLAGVLTPNTNYVQFRVVDALQEAPVNQYDGDLWGLYLAVENAGGRFVDEHELADGNVYEIEGGNGDIQHQAADQPSNASDWNSFRNNAQSGNASEAWWRANVNLENYYSFDAITRAVSNVDVRPGDNYAMYHDPDGHWRIIPWDLDMMYIAETHQTGSNYYSTYLSKARLVSALELEFKNRARELMDLMFSDASSTGGQVAQLVDEYARMVNASNGAGGYLAGWAEIDQYLWNYNPRTTNDHEGAFYKTPFVDNQRFGGNWTRTLPTANFSGMVQWIINFMTDTDPNSWSIGDGDQRGYGFNYLEYEAADANIPNKPSITYSGNAGYPIDKLKFSTGAFSDPNGNPFAAMEWRIGEISNPNTPGFDPDSSWKYEVESTWESGELTSYASDVTIPTAALEAGHTYRARVRMKDSTGRWSRWSSPIEFLAAEAASPITLAISEVNYHPPDNPNLADPEDLEFIEIVNFGPQTVSLAGIRLTEFASPEVYSFDSNLSLAPGKRIVVARDPAVFQSVYGTAINLAPTGFKFDGKNLSNSGERIVLLGPAGETLADVNYTDDPPWPTAADGRGPSLEIIDPTGDESAPTNWRASLANGGSPGTDGVSHANLPGDYDGNGAVEQADYEVWKTTFSIPVAPFTSADGNGDGKIDAADYSVWRDNLGSILAAGSAAVALTMDDSPVTVAALDAAYAELLAGATGSASAIQEQPKRPTSTAACTPSLLLATRQSPSQADDLELQSTLSTAGASQALKRTDSSGRTSRKIIKNGPSGAGSQFASLSPPGGSF